MRAGRCSAKAVPATAWPGLSPIFNAQSGTTAIASPAAYDQRSASISGHVQVDPGAVGLEQAGRLVDDLLEDLVGLEDGRHAGRDLAQRPLGVGPPGDLRPGSLERLDQPGVGDGDRGLVGQRAEQGRAGGIERVRAVAVDGDRADRHVAVDERRRDDRPDAGLANERVALGCVLEPVVLEIGAGPFDPAGPDRPPGHARVEVEADLAQQRPCWRSRAARPRGSSRRRRPRRRRAGRSSPRPRREAGPTRR